MLCDAWEKGVVAWGHVAILALIAWCGKKHSKCKQFSTSLALQIASITVNISYFALCGSPSCKTRSKCKLFCIFVCADSNKNTVNVSYFKLLEPTFGSLVSLSLGLWAQMAIPTMPGLSPAMPELCRGLCSDMAPFGPRGCAIWFCSPNSKKHSKYKLFYTFELSKLQNTQ